MSSLLTMLRVGVGVLLVGLLVVPSSCLAETEMVHIHVALTHRHPLSPLAFGVNYATTTLLQWGTGVNRQSGDASSKYNYRIDLTNSAADYFWLTDTPFIPNQPPTPPHTSFIDGMYTRSVDSLQTVFISPLLLLGYVVSDPSNGTCCSFPVSQFGPQQSAHGDCGNGVAKNGTLLDSSWKCFERYGIADNLEWLSHMEGLRGREIMSERLLVQSVDNEPDCFSPVHRDVHPNNFSYDELWSAVVTYGSLLKQLYPSMHINGPSWSNFCWWYYVRGDGCGGTQGKDFLSHNSEFTMHWLMRRMNEYYLATGIKLLDSVDFHYYPNAMPSRDDTPEQQQAILDEVRSLYDWSYNDPGDFGQCGKNCHGPALALLPRMLSEIEEFAPQMGLKLTMSEYAFTFNDSCYTAALAVTEVLSLFSHWGVYMAARWIAPKENSIAEQAFKVFLNYDYNMSKISGEAVNTTSSHSPNQTSYSVYNSTSQRLFVLLFNRDLDALGESTFSVEIADAVFSNGSSTATSPVYTLTPTAPSLALRAFAQVTSSNSQLGFQFALPARSFALIVIDQVALADGAEQVHWQPRSGPSVQERVAAVFEAEAEQPITQGMKKQLEKASLQHRIERKRDLARHQLAAY